MVSTSGSRESHAPMNAGSGLGLRCGDGSDLVRDVLDPRLRS